MQVSELEGLLIKEMRAVFGRGEKRINHSLSFLHNIGAYARQKGRAGLMPSYLLKKLNFTGGGIRPYP